MSRYWANWTFPRWILLLKIGVSVFLLARGWLTWRWDSPIRGLVWQERWWSSWLQSAFDLSWNEFAQQSDRGITSALTCLGIALMLGAIVPWLIAVPRFNKLRWVLLPLTLILALDGLGRYVDSNFQIATAIEYAMQIVTPMALFLATGTQANERIWIQVISIATALTFVGHGIYAIGLLPVPVHFQSMTTSILHCSQESAFLFLKVVGILDILAAIALLFRPLRPVALGYLILWGAATAAARVVAHLDFQTPGFHLDPWFIETLVRTPHWLLPLLLLWLHYGKITFRKTSP